MPSVLEQVLEPVLVQLHAVRAERNRSPFDATRWGIGRLDLDKHKGQSYITWVPVGGPLRKPDGLNTIRDTEGNSVKPRYQSDLTVECWICDRSFAETEATWCEVLEAEYRALGAHRIPGAFRWVTQEVEKAGHALGGVELLVQEFTFPLIVPAEIKRLVTLTTTDDHECSLIP